MKLFIGLKRGLRFAVSPRAGKNQHAVGVQDSYKKGLGKPRPRVLSRNTLLHECCRPKGGLVRIDLNCSRVIHLYR